MIVVMEVSGKHDGGKLWWSRMENVDINARDNNFGKDIYIKCVRLAYWFSRALLLHALAVPP